MMMVEKVKIPESSVSNLKTLSQKLIDCIATFHISTLIHIYIETTRPAPQGESI